VGATKTDDLRQALADIAWAGKRLVELIKKEPVVSLPRIVADITDMVDRAEAATEAAANTGSARTSSTPVARIARTPEPIGTDAGVDVGRYARPF